MWWDLAIPLLPSVFICVFSWNWEIYFRNYRSKHIKITNQNILVSCINNTIDYGLKKKNLHQPCPSKIWRNTLSYVMNQVYRHWRPRHFKISCFTNFSRNTEKPFHKLPSSGESHTLLCYTFYCVWGAIFFEWGILKSCSREKPPTPNPEIPKKVLRLLIRDQGGILALSPKGH